MKRHSQLWSYAIGLAFFAFSLGIFMPLSVSLAGGNSNTSPGLMQICGIGGVQFVAPATTEDANQTRVTQGHEYCVYSGLGDTPFLAVKLDGNLKRAENELSQQFCSDDLHLSGIKYLIGPIRAPPIAV
ncbi:hypothetical protein [Curvivirga sp.]|uniref:hypothetical protein n=1 Tax=Curvivirga sp. TaxID=2856848 RepID=UPI003B58DABF